MSLPVSSFPISPPGPTRATRSTRTKISLAERLLVVVTAVNLVLLAWAFGGVDLWSQLLSAGLSAVAFGLGWWSRASHARAGLHPAWSALRRFPVFWAGLVLFGYVLVQYFNPAFVYRQAGGEWWLEAIPYLRGLPAGMAVPFADAGPRRVLLLWFPSWALTCALWIGLVHRGAVLALLNVVAANGFLLAAFGLVQRAAGTTDIYGLRHTESAEIFASFIYRNHAAAYFHLVALVAIALALHEFWRRRQPNAKPHGPAIVHFLFAATAVSAVVLTFSFGGVLLLIASWALLLSATAGQFLYRRKHARISWPGVVVAAICLSLVGTLAAYSSSMQLRDKLREKLGGGAGQSWRMRWLADRQGAQMLGDRPILGWGAGSFRYGFTKYQRAEIEITGVGLRRHFWEHAHNDWLETLIELGTIGFLPIAIMLGWWLRRQIRGRVWRQSFLLWGAAGPATLGLYALFDFPFQNPAIVLTTTCIMCVVARWDSPNPLASRTNSHPQFTADE